MTVARRCGVACACGTRRQPILKDSGGGSDDTHEPKETLINGGDAIVCGLGERFFLSKPPAHSGGRDRMAWCRQADASFLRARYRFASANSENTWAPFLAMPR